MGLSAPELEPRAVSSIPACSRARGPRAASPERVPSSKVSTVPFRERASLVALPEPVPSSKVSTASFQEQALRAASPEPFPQPEATAGSLLAQASAEVSASIPRQAGSRAALHHLQGGRFPQLSCVPG